MRRGLTLKGKDPRPCIKRERSELGFAKMHAQQFLEKVSEIHPHLSTFLSTKLRACSSPFLVFFFRLFLLSSFLKRGGKSFLTATKEKERSQSVQNSLKKSHFNNIASEASYLYFAKYLNFRAKLFEKVHDTNKSDSVVKLQIMRHF